jgi:myosin tail region-interacting protein MTI1
MAVTPYKVKATYDYNSPHDDDLSFTAGQIITVTEEEDADWYVGEYPDASGEIKSGLFPKNFVERYEPAPPPRPVRAAKSKPVETPVEQPVPEPEPQITSAPPRQEPITAPAKEIIPEPVPPPVQRAVDPAPPKAKSPPPVAEKSSSFKDRIAAFNKTSAPPIAPFKPASLGSAGFIKKPFVAPPPARNAYVAPPREAAPQKVYRREEDPEIAERQAQDVENAEKAGLIPGAQDDEAEEAPKAVSLKERIALLQKQQMEQASRRSDVVKEKPKRPPKRRTDSQEQVETAEHAEIPTSEPVQRGSSDLDREHHEAVRKHVRPPKGAEVFSDGNEADQSAAGETTEEADGASTGVDEEEAREKKTSKTAPAPEDAAEEDESTEEEEEDEETRHQQALRQRMAKLSGGMGMPGMFGPPGGMPMMGMGAAPKKKKPAEKKVESQEEASTMAQAPRIPVLPMPGINRANTGESEPGPLSRSSTQRGFGIDDDSTEVPSPSGNMLQSYLAFPTPPPKYPNSVCRNRYSKTPSRRSYRSERDAINWILSN